MLEPGLVVGVSTSEWRGTGKINVGNGYLERDYGLLGDAHAGTERPVSVLALECIEEAITGKGIAAKPGDFAENITVNGLNLEGIAIGARLALGEAEVEVIQIGKVIDASHAFNFHGLALLVSRGCFCRVVKSGRVRVGDRAKVLS
jgi:MOSC domain-containing protein YiiM